MLGEVIGEGLGQSEGGDADEDNTEDEEGHFLSPLTSPIARRRGVDAPLDEAVSTKAANAEYGRWSTRTRRRWVHQF